MLKYGMNCNHANLQNAIMITFCNKNITHVVKTTMMSWLFGSSKEIKLILQPDHSAKILPGFKFGDPLHLTGIYGDSVGTIMDRFNAYRAPDSQITKLWNLDGSPLPFSTCLTDSITAIVKA